MKRVIRLSTLALALVCAAAVAAFGQTPTPTPDPFVTQISSSALDTFVRDISGDGRFVVVESNGDIATLLPGQTAATKSPNNADGNREIFLFDFAQRRIFQITDTRNILINTTLTGAALRAQENVSVEITNHGPSISRDGKWIAFSSNGYDPDDPASSPLSFNGETAASAVQNRVRADGNTELFLYRIPDVPAADLTSGDTPAFVNLGAGTIRRVTNTPTSRTPRRGTVDIRPFFADDNRAPQLNDDGSRIAFISTRDFAATSNGLRNTDASPEVFVFVNQGAGSLTQVTNTSLDQNLLVFTENPNISGNATGDSTVVFASNATDLRIVAGTGGANIAAANTDGNAELFVATFTGSAVSAARQATRTRRNVQQDLVNVLSPGRRLSRDGALVAFESVAADPKADATTNETNRAIFVYNLGADTFTQVGPRASTDDFEDVYRFPTFTRNEADRRLIFVSNLNLKADGTRAEFNDTTGLNPSRFKQVWSAPVPATSGSIAPTRLTNVANGESHAVAIPTFVDAHVGNTQERVAFTLALTEFGTGNADQAHEGYYLIVPPAPAASDTTATPAALTYFTGASLREVVTPTATPSPSPSPVTGLAPGMIGVVRTNASIPLAPSAKNVCPAPGGCDAASESQRRPPLPVELNGVSLSVNGAAAGLYFVSPTEIQFVVPPGLTAQTGTATYPVVIRIRQGDGTVRVVRSVLQVVTAQPDIFTTTNGPGGRAQVTNVTNPLLAVGLPEPFTVRTTFVNSSGQSVTEQTRLRLLLTGVRGIGRGAITVRLVRISDNTTTDITGDNIPTDPQLTDVPGVLTLDFRLPDSLAGAGDVAVIVLVNAGGSTFSSRPADTAPRFQILPNPASAAPPRN